MELTQACLERIEAIDDKLHSFITVTADSALEQARRVEQELRAGTDRGSLHGIPIALKDLYATKGVRTTCHSAVMQDWIPDEDATAAVKLSQAGTVLLGKLGMHEFAFGGPSVDAPFPAVAIRGTRRTFPGVRAAAPAPRLAAGCAWALWALTPAARSARLPRTAASSDETDLWPCQPLRRRSAQLVAGSHRTDGTKSGGLRCLTAGNCRL